MISEQKERPILMSAPMVLALLEGRKTQTRRIMNPQPDHLQHHAHRGKVVYEGEHRMWCWKDLVLENIWDFPANEDRRILASRNPYGKPGDRLWVKEAHYRYGHWEAVPGIKTKTGRMKWRFVADTTQILYEPPPSILGFRKGRHHKDPGTMAWHKRLARFMPKSASRITLEVTEVRVQRLQEISEADAQEEGFDTMEKQEKYGLASWSRHHHPNAEGTPVARKSFIGIWESINGAGSWDANPWDWAVSFNVVQP